MVNGKFSSQQNLSFYLAIGFHRQKSFSINGADNEFLKSLLSGGSGEEFTE